jgi:hypothetical protein
MGPFLIQMLSFKFIDLHLLPALLLSVHVVPVLAGADMFVCTDAKGTRTYQNTGQTEHCRKLNLEPVLTVPAPPHITSGNKTGAATPRPSGGASAQAASGQYADTATSDRDVDRRKILEQELLQEEGRLSELRQRSQSSSDARLLGEVSRSEASIASLKREISKLRRP